MNIFKQWHAISKAGISLKKPLMYFLRFLATKRMNKVISKALPILNIESEVRIKTIYLPTVTILVTKNDERVDLVAKHLYWKDLDLTSH